MPPLRLVLAAVCVAPWLPAQSSLRLAAFGTGAPGQSVALLLQAPGQGGLPYQVLSSLGTGPLRLGQHTLHLTPDTLFWLTAQNLLPTLFRRYRGFLDAQGTATAAIQVPRHPALLGLELFTAFVTYRTTPPYGLVGVSPTVETVLGKSRYWQTNHYDPEGTRRYPYRSILPTRGTLTTLTTLTFGALPTVLTADLTGDGVADVIARVGKQQLTAYTAGPTGLTALWTYTASAAAASWFSYVGDVDQDGKPEVLFPYRDKSQNLVTDVLDEKGTLQKTLNLGPWSGSFKDYGLRPLTAQGDWILFAFTAGYNRQPRGPGLVQYSTGKLAAFFATGGGCLGMGPTAVGDGDGDGRPDLALSWATWHNGASGNGTTDGDCYGVVVEADLTATPPTLQAVFSQHVKSWNSKANPDGVFTTMMPDLDQSGTSEILFFHGHDQRYYRGRDYIYAARYPSGSLATLVDLGWSDGGFYLRSTVVRDLTGDRVEDLVVSPWTTARFGRLLLLDGATLKQVRTAAHPGRILAALADLTGDGTDELLTYDPAGPTVQLLDARTFQPLGPGVTLPGSLNVGGLAVADITGEGTPEILLGVNPGTGGALVVLAVR